MKEVITLGIYSNIKILADKKRISIAQIERECELSSASISKWNKSVPSARSLSKVAEYLGVSTDDLINQKQEA